jgi:hypothetical protein
MTLRGSGLTVGPVRKSSAVAFDLIEQDARTSANFSTQKRRWRNCSAMPWRASCSPPASPRIGQPCFAHACRLGAEPTVSKNDRARVWSGSRSPPRKGRGAAAAPRRRAQMITGLGWQFSAPLRRRQIGRRCVVDPSSTTASCRVVPCYLLAGCGRSFGGYRSRYAHDQAYDRYWRIGSDEYGCPLRNDGRSVDIALLEGRFPCL